MNNWINVSQSDVNKPLEKKVRGINVVMMISPFDVPVASRYGLNSKTNEFVVEFKYLASSEYTKVVDHADGVKFELGCKTGKVFKVLIDNNHFQTNGYDSVDVSIELGLKEALREINEHESDFTRAGNFSAIRNYLSHQTQVSV